MADVLGKKISELAETTNLAGLYTIGSDKNNQSKKVSLQFVKEASDYANAQGDYAKTVGDTVQGNTGVDEYPVFNASQQYAAGDVVRYEGRLYKFTALHAAGAWVGTDVVETSIKAEADLKLAELNKLTGVKTVVIPQLTTGKRYDLNTRMLVEDELNVYAYSSVVVPENVETLTMPFLSSTKGASGVEFRDGANNKISSYFNGSEPAGTYITIPVPQGAKTMIFTYFTEERAEREGVPLKPDITWGVNEVYASVSERIGKLTTDLDTSGLIEVSYRAVEGKYYSLLDRVYKDNASYFFTEIDIPRMAKSCLLPLPKSTGGGLGVEFRNVANEKISSYTNTAEDGVTYFEIGIPSGATKMIYSYPLGNLPIVRFRLYGIEDFAKNNDFPKLPIFGGAQLYLSKPTGNHLQDGLTIDELYAEYDALVEQFPQWITRKEDLGLDSSGTYAIRQYEVRMTNPWLVNGESGMIGKGNSVNLWTDADYAYNTILINAGTHGDEKGPCWATMLAIKDIVESTAPWAMFIKSSFIIKVCPCLNPYGFQHRTLANANGVNINRDTINFTQPETIAWKTWIDNNSNAVAYIDMHGVDYYYPFFEFSSKNSEENKKLYVQLAAQLAAGFSEDWRRYLGYSKDDYIKYPRPYAIVSTHEGTTSDYIASKGLKGFTLETPCDIVNNRKLEAPNYFTSYSKSNKLSVDMLINVIQYLGLSTDALGEIPSAESSVFEAVYNVTPYSDIVEAYKANKHCICRYNNMLFLSLVKLNFEGNDTAQFAAIVEDTQYILYCFNNNTWGNTFFRVEKATNKVTSISQSSNNNEYPSAKAVYDFVNNTLGTIINGDY